MYARSTTIVAQPDHIDAGIAFINDEVMEMMTAIDGCMGLSLLVDRGSGRCIATTSWESAEMMHASNEQLQPVRQRMLETVSGTGLDVQEWEIALLHRDHESPAGACARVTWARPREGQLDAAVEAYKTIVMPLLEETDGFCSSSMIIDRGTGMLCGTASFESMAAVEATRDFAAAQRAKMAARTGIEFVDVMECELADRAFDEVREAGRVVGVATGVAGLVEGDGVGADPDGRVTLEPRVHHPVETRHRVPRRLISNRTCRLEEQPEARRALLDR